MIYDVIIIGAGINGILSLEYMLKRGHKAILLEKNSRPISFLYDYMCDDLEFVSTGDKLGIPGSQIVVGYLKQFFDAKAQHHKKHIIFSEEVIDLIKDKDTHLFDVRTNNGSFSCKNIILATGRNIPKAFDTFCNVSRSIGIYNNKKILLVGSGDSAGDFIFHNYKNNKIYWANKNRDVTKIFHKSIKKKYQQIDKKNIEIFQPHELSDIGENKMKCAGRTIDYDVCVCLTGFNLNDQLLRKVGVHLVEVNNKFFVKVDKSYETNIKNIFGVGEIVLQPSPPPRRAFIEHTPTILERIWKKMEIK